MHTDTSIIFYYTLHTSTDAIIEYTKRAVMATDMFAAIEPQITFDHDFRASFCAQIHVHVGRNDENCNEDGIKSQPINGASQLHFGYVFTIYSGKIVEMDG